MFIFSLVGQSESHSNRTKLKKKAKQACAFFPFNLDYKKKEEKNLILINLKKCQNFLVKAAVRRATPNRKMRLSRPLLKNHKTSNKKI